MKIRLNTIGVVTSLLAASALTLKAQPYPTAVLADHPTAYWKLNETSGTVAADSAGSDNGSYTNVTLGQTGYAEGLAAEYSYSPATDTSSSAGFGSPTPSYVSGMTLDFASATNVNFSVEAWVQASGGQSGGAAIVGKGWGGGGEEYYIDTGSSGTGYRFFIRIAGGTPVNAVSTQVPGADGNWHHLVGVCDETVGEIYFYVDGQLAASNSVTGGINSTTNQYMSIGCRQAAQNGPFNDQFVGEIGQVAVYASALTAQQVQNHYVAAGIPPVVLTQLPNTEQVNAGATLIIPTTTLGTSPLYYQWYSNSVAIGGQTSATLDLTDISTNFNDTEIYLAVSNQYGSTASGATYLELNTGAPQFVTNLGPSQLSLYEGVEWTYFVVVQNNSPFYYQWFLNGAQISNATNSSYTVTTPAGTNVYTVSVSNNYNGGSTNLSNPSTLIGVPVPTQSYPATILAANPVAYWRLDETEVGGGDGGVTAYDYVGGHNGIYNGVLLGVPGYSPDDPDTACDFGTNANPSFTSGSYMQEVDNAGNGVPLIDSYLQGASTAFSVECWVNAPAGGESSGGSPIISLGNLNSEAFYIDANGPGGTFRYMLRLANGSSAGIINGTIAPDGNWHQLIAVCDEIVNGATVFYIDGNLQGTLGTINGKGVYTASSPLWIGNDGTSEQYNGTVDEVSFYNYALSSSQLQAHYKAAPLPPAFEVVPPAAVSSYVGGTVTLSATELGSAPITNQWFSNNVSLAGQTNVFLVLSNLKSGTNTFELKATNAYGHTNTAGTLVQVAGGSGPPVLLADVKPLNQVLYAGETASYSVTVSGSAPLTYLWYSNGTAVASATASSYTIANLTTNDAGSYFCAISNSLGTNVSSTAVLGVTAAPTNPYSLTVMNDRPSCYWRLDEANGALLGYDYVGGNIGIYSNTAGITHQAGIFGTEFDADTAAYFNTNGSYTKANSGSSNYLGATMTNVDFSVPNGLNGEFSVEAWAKGFPSELQVSGGGIVAKGYGNGGEEFNLDVHGGFRFYARTASGGLAASAQAAEYLDGTGTPGVVTNWVMDGKWHHLVGVCDEANDNLLLYVDGTLIGYPIISNGVVPPLAYIYQTNHTGSTGTNGLLSATPGGGYGIFAATNYTTGNAALWDYNSVSIGARNSGSGNTGLTLGFDGAVDEVALYNYCLTPLQVSNHYAVAINQSTTLSVQQTGNVTTVSWFADWATSKLQSSTNLTGPWTTIPGATSPYTVTNTGGQAVFYRVKND